MRRDQFTLPIRIVVEAPLPNLEIALQRGKADKAQLIMPTGKSADAVAFDLDIRVGGRLDDGRPRLLGPFVQGPPEARFVYLSVGRYAGQADSPWAGRVKVPLDAIQWDRLAELTPGYRLTARVPGQSNKGGPALASVRLLPPGWDYNHRH